jgi:hypothetical protein
MKQSPPGYYSLAEAAAYLHLSKPVTSRVAKSKKQQWPVYEVGNVHLYREEDIHEYRDHQLRTQLVEALGWRGRGLYRADDIDISCPICDAFAIEWPAPPELSTKFMCLNGHEGELR